MSFIGAAAAIGFTGMGATIAAGVMMGGAVTVGTNLIRGNDPFDNIGQGMLVGGIGGAFSPAAGAAGGAGDTVATELAAAEAMAGPAAIDTGNAAANIAANSTSSMPGTNIPGGNFGFNDSLATSQTFPPNHSYWSQTASGPTVVTDASPVQAGQITSNASASAPSVAGKPPGTSPNFWDDPFHKDNRGTALLGGLGVAGAMGAFNPRTGLNNLPPRTYEVANTTYSPGARNPNFGKPGEPYFLGQGYGPMTRETRTAAAGGGIRALSEGGYVVPMPSRGFMTNKESIPDSADDSAAFKRYLKSDINKDEETGQAAIDKTVMAWLERHAKADVKGMAEGGLSTPPASYQQPQYQMSDFANSPLFQPTGGNAPVQPGISEYTANMNQYTPPAPAAAPAPVVTDTTSPILYNQNTQRFLDNPNYAAPVAPVAPVDNDGGGDGGGRRYRGGDGDGDKAGGPIKSRRYAGGGLAALPEYAAGGQLLSGDGDGMSDSIPAVIKGARPQRAALADGEFVIPADVVSHLGNGSTKAGGKRLYEMMATIRKARTGNSKQGKQINPMKFMPT